MRILLIFWCLNLAHSVSNAQNVNIAMHSHIDDAYSIVAVNSRFFNLEKIVPQCGNDSANIVGRNSSGNIIFKKKLNFVEVHYPKKLIRTLDNCLLTSGPSHGCDYFSNSDGNFIIKIDTNGVVKFQTLHPFGGQNGGNFVDFVQHDDSSYYFVSHTDLFHFSKNGVFMSRVSTGITNINSISNSGNGNFVINGKINNVLKNIFLTPANTIVVEEVATNIILKSAATNNAFYNLTSVGTIEKLSSALISVGNTSNSISPDFKISDFIVRSDSLFVTGINTVSKKPFYLILNQNLNSVFATQGNYRNIYPSGITIGSNNRINIIARATSTIENFTSFSSYYQFPITGNFYLRLDVGVESFSMISSNYSSSSLDVYNVNLQVKIKNYTGDTVKDFYLNSGGFQKICCRVFLHKLFRVTLLPFATVTVQTGTFYQLSNTSIVATEPNRFYREICIFTTVPNFENDIDISNDEFCQLTPLNIVGLQENAMDSQVVIFPNPFTSELKIDSEIRIAKIEIYSLTGQLLLSDDYHPTVLRFEERRFPAGLYLLKLETENGILFKKLTKL